MSTMRGCKILTAALNDINIFWAITSENSTVQFTQNFYKYFLGQVITVNIYCNSFNFKHIGNNEQANHEPLIPLPAVIWKILSLFSFSRTK